MGKDIRNFNLKAHNTFGIEQTCRRFIEFDSVDELLGALQSLTENDRPLLLIGGGSNLLLTKRFEGTVLHSAIGGCETVDAEGRPCTPADDAEGVVFLRCGSGVVWDDMVALAVSRGWHGAENLSLIPGEVGASAVQNIGAYGAEVKDIIHRVEAVDIETLQPRTFSPEECDYAYRYSRFKGEWRGRYIITHVTYRLSRQFTPHIDYGNIRAELEARGITEPSAAQLREVIIDIRRAKLPDPELTGNAGSFFMNPVVDSCVYERIAKDYERVPHYPAPDGKVKIPAGWMIEQCGWKGRALGQAGVHHKQALVLVNLGGATGADIVALSDAVRKDVFERFGIDIHPEVNII